MPRCRICIDKPVFAAALFFLRHILLLIYCIQGIFGFSLFGFSLLSSPLQFCSFTALILEFFHFYFGILRHSHFGSDCHSHFGSGNHSHFGILRHSHFGSGNHSYFGRFYSCFGVFWGGCSCGGHEGVLRSCCEWFSWLFS